MTVALLFLVGLLTALLIGPFVVLFVGPSMQIVSLTAIEEWLGLPLNLETFQLWIVIFMISSAGGIFGIAMKHYQAHNWKLTWEDLCYYLMSASLSVLFLINAAATSPTICFTIPAGFNGGLGVIRNMYENRKNGTSATP